MKEKMDELAEKARKLASDVKLADSEDWAQLKEVASQLGEEAAVFVRKYPLQSVLGAAALGFVLGSTLGLGRKK
jgi:ElaB/YqjD/DUF883 family membrane-anchored ribosome-binding protein